MQGRDNHNLSLWLKSNKEFQAHDKEFKAHDNATFVEYLRWMRSPKPVIESSQEEIDKQNKEENNLSKLIILQLAAEKAKGYQQYLKKFNERTKKIAGENNTFEVKCSWRVRVGGYKGPENILLPAFDALGMPYIPSSSLRGVARNQAFWEITQNKIATIKNQKGNITDADKQEAKRQAEQEVAKYFGSLEAEEQDRIGKVIFLDAYPLHNQWGLQGRGLAVDMANNIWSWKEDDPEYSPNPNTFLSLNEPTFLIGLRLTPRCNKHTFERVKNWLKQGLQSGIGSQVNTGYGEMIIKGEPIINQPFFQVNFTITGQLIHGCQKFKNVSQPFQKDRNGGIKTDKKGNPKVDTYPEPEVRPVAFKSMLRYWFRTLTLGFLSSTQVQEYESKLFGSIQSQTQGWVKVQIANVRNSRDKEQDKEKNCLQQKGTLNLNYSREIPEESKTVIENLFKNLTWLMFHLGGVGQGARRPLYSRKDRTEPNPPWYRGTSLKAEKNNVFGELPDTCQDFTSCFQGKLQHFCEALATLTQQEINWRSPLSVEPLENDEWREAIDKNCQLIICSGNQEVDKPYALAILHLESFKITNKKGQKIYDPKLCGDAGDRSPIWIADLGNYQIVTVFGATSGKRQEFVRELNSRASVCLQIFPI